MEEDDSSHILTPQPRRPANTSLTPKSSASSNNSTSDYSPFEHITITDLNEDMDTLYSSHKNRDRKSSVGIHDGRGLQVDGGQTPQTSRSMLNLTDSTLFGIFSPTGVEPTRDEPPTPFGAGAQTPSLTSVRGSLASLTSQAFWEKARIKEERKKERRKSMKQQQMHLTRSHKGSQVGSAIFRSALLFAFGMAYGEVITQLHDSGRVAPVQVDRINRASWIYLGFWGITGVAMGALLPYIDHAPQMWSSQDCAIDDDDVSSEKDAPLTTETSPNPQSTSYNTIAADWNDIVRSIGAFVGIAFAIRKLSWQSTLQVSLTLALVNPVIWYLMDRTRSGFTVSCVFGVIGAGILLGINPEWVPAPATASQEPSASYSAKSSTMKRENFVRDHAASQTDLLAGLLSYEQIGVATWVSSVLFCSSIFFGNLGRKLLANT